MPGFEHTANDTIEDLRRNLRDRYKDCHAVLKELIQNADDAFAGELHLAWVPGVPNARNKLLRGPQLLIVNNGRFTFKDSYAIHLAGAGSKGNDEGKIGKFGLGLKSVFHLCEAYFYLSDREGDAEEAEAQLKKYGRRGVLSPWSGARYTEWDSFCEDDQELLEALISTMRIKPGNGWFALCLPLRTQDHCRETPDDDPAEWAIEPRYYGEACGEPPEDVFSANRVAGIRHMLPLMSTLEAVRFSRFPAGGDGSPTLIAAVTRSAPQHLNWRKLTPGRSLVAGRVEVASNGRVQQHIYAGMQVLLRSERLDNLPKHAEWPRMDTQTDTGRKREPAAVKQHAAVVVIEQPGGGALRVDRAVFLPLGDPPHPECQSAGPHDYDLILHGYFFVDAGRRGVDFASDGEATLRQQWNAALYQDGTLPLLIPALDAFAKTIAEQPDAHDRVQLLTSLLNQPECHLWRDHSEEICREYAWCFRLASGTGSWQAIERDLPLVLLPGHRLSDRTIPFDVFPAIGSLAERYAISLAGLPRLTTTMSSAWPEEFSRKLLDSVVLANVVDNEKGLEYLRRVCEELHAQGGDARSDIIVAFLRRLFREIPLAKLRDLDVEVTKLVACMPSGRLLPIPFNANLVRESERLFTRLAAENTQVLPVPALFFGNHTRNATLSTAEARVLLEALSNLQPSGSQEDLFHSLVGQAISAVFIAWPESRSTLLTEFGDLPIFYSRNYASDSRLKCSAFELKTALSEHRLFTVNAGLCPKLQAAIDGVEVLYLLGDKTLNEQLAVAVGDIPGCDAAACASLLARRPKLVELATARVALLDELLRGFPADGREDLCIAARYLLHGHRDDSGRAELLTGDTDAWTALAQILLDSAGDGWRLIAKRLLDNVTHAQMAPLGIRQASPGEVVRLVANANVAGLDCTPVTSNPAWRNEIIANWPEADKECLKSLPIFPRVDGDFASITRHTFIRGTLPLPPIGVFPDLELVEDPKGVIAKRQLAPTLAPAELVSAALDDTACHRHWRFILETTPDEPGDDLANKLRTARWLPDLEGDGHAPLEVVTHGSLRRYVTLLRQADRRVIHIDDLAVDIRQHRRIAVITNWCPRGKELFQVVGAALTGVSEFWIGENIVDEKSLSAFIAMFGHDEGDAVMPSAHLLFLLQEEMPAGAQWLSQHVLPAVRHRVDADRYKRILLFLSHRHQRAAGSDRADILDVFNRYLVEAAKHGVLRKVLPEILLLNQDGRWVHPSTLAMLSDNVAAPNLLAREHASAMRDYDTARPAAHADNLNIIIDRRFDQQSLDRSAAILRAFLDTWRSDDIPDDAIAAVVSVLGDNDGFPALYERLRDARTLAAIRGRFSWQPSGPGWNIRELMTKQHFCILPADADTVVATNLLGEAFDAPVSARLECLFDGFDGRSYFPLPNDERCYLIHLRKIDPLPLSVEDRLQILARSFLSIRSLIHRQADEDFQAIWNHITNVGQLDIELAQELILESSAMLLETQLSIRASPQLKLLFGKWHQVRQRAKTATTQLERNEADDDRRKVLEELRDLLREDRSTQQLLVGEIRKRLEAASYSASSIPFELFQNGDDAVVELESLCQDKELLEKARPLELRHRFAVEATVVEGNPVLRFFHWGRGINQYRIGMADGRSDGYDRDMERMLVLQGSGKDEDGPGDRRTGKFGLGFKSVFFVCDSPRVLSGARSRFRVVAGVYPDQLSASDEARLQRALDGEGDQFHRGTVVELPLRGAGDARTSLERFNRLAGYLVVFARRIRRCSITGSGQGSLGFEWSPRSLIPGVETGRILDGAGRQQGVLVFRVGSEGYGAVLVPLCPEGVSDEVARDVPEVWVTTPTEEPGIGRLLVNGSFDLNPGRTQLRRTDENVRIAREMGEALGEQLCSLYAHAATNWPTTRDAMGCTQATADAFWTSLWHACERYVLYGPENEVLRSVLYGSEHCGLHRLIREARALPTGLPAEYDCLTRLQDVHWHLSGVLADPGVWSTAVQCRWIRTHVVPGTIVGPAIFEVLEALCPVDARSLALKTIVEGSFPDGYFADASVSHELGMLLPPERLNKMSTDKRSAQEEGELRELLSDVKFQTVAGNWRVGCELLIKHGDRSERIEERRRASFAPDDRVIDPRYEGAALDFFLSCREEMRTSAMEMATWILHANDLTARKAALEYLERGAQHFNVGHELNELKKQVTTSWLDDKSELDAAMPTDANSQAVVMGKLRKGTEFQQQETGPRKSPPPPIATRKPGAVLKDIHAWWTQNRDEIITHHDAMIYPGGKPPKLKWTASQQQLVADADVRRGWLILLMRGSMYRIGRATHHQHQGFLEMCVERGWLDALATSGEEQSRWFAIMEDYLDSLQGESAYYHWMAQFLAYYQIARWLPRYARSFEAITRPGVNLSDLRSIRDIADLRTSHFFGRATGFDAPPCSRMLGLGAHFVLRETARLRQTETRGAVINPRLAPLAFVPAWRTRKLMAQLLGRGDQHDQAVAAQLVDAKCRREDASKAIEKVLRKYLGDGSTFDGAFDVPLLVLTWPKYASVCAELLGQAAPAVDGGPMEFLDEPTDDSEVHR